MDVRPTSGWALVAVLEADGHAASQLTRAIATTGADVRTISARPDGSRELTVDCASCDQQDAVRAAINATPGVRVCDIVDATFAMHEGGKVDVAGRRVLLGPADLAMAYTPGVGRVSDLIAQRPDAVWRYTGRANSVAILTDGSAVLGLGNIGPEAALPVMEGKAVLFKQFGGLDAYPLCVRTRSVDELVAVAAALAPGFGGINLEDIAAPGCFEVEERLQEMLDIPVFHDDQHGTAIVVLAALYNAVRVVGKEMTDLKVTILGAGAAGTACARLLRAAGVGDITGVDRDGIITANNAGASVARQWFAANGNRSGRTGEVRDALADADVLVGVSGPGAVDPSWLGAMAGDAIVFALANPVPEVMPEFVTPNVAVVATGRSDYPNQINNVLAFPGVFRGMLDVRAQRCSEEMKLAAARAMAALVPDPSPSRIIPGVFEAGVAPAVATAIATAAVAHGLARPMRLDDLGTAVSST